MLAGHDTTVDEQLAGPEFFADPYATYRQLRAGHPVFWSERWGSWLVARYGDIVDALRDHSLYSNTGRQAAMIARLSAGQQSDFSGLSSHYTNGGLSNQDPPKHTRLRGLINLAFTPRVIEALEPRIRETANDLLDALATGEPVDFIKHVANPLPAIVIADLLGLPKQDRESFRSWSNDVTAFLGTGSPDESAATLGQEAMLQLRAYLAEKLAERRACSAQDLLSRFAVAGDLNDVLSENEAVGSCVTLLMGGHETTANLLGNGLLALLRHPDQLALLRENPALIPDAIEEMLRLDAPVQRIWRTVRHDIIINGQLLRAGDSVFLMTGAANRDESHFDDAEQLDIRRKPNRHLTFGLGIHFCLGAALARLEARVAFSTLFERFGHITLAQDSINYHPNIAFRGLVSLPVVLSTTIEGGMPMGRVEKH
jgi:cytochrome P450